MIWDWQALGVIAATALSVAAFVVSLVGLRHARRSADAAERSAPPKGVAWELAHFENDAFLLTNVGRSSAYDVRVDFPETIRGSAPETAVVEPDDFVKFLALRTLATHDDTVTVTWATRPDGGEERARWRRPLPSRPPLGPEPFVVWG